MGTRTELSMLTWIIQKTYSLPSRIDLMHLISLRRMSSSDSSYQGSGGNTDVYGHVLAPEILRAFSADFCRLWPIHTKKYTGKQNHKFLVSAE